VFWAAMNCHPEPRLTATYFISVRSTASCELRIRRMAAAVSGVDGSGESLAKVSAD